MAATAPPIVHAFSSSLLPHLSTLDSTLSFSQTVSPFLPQFRTVPLALYHALTKNPDLSTLPQQLLTIYHTTNPLISAFLISQVVAVFCFLTAEATQNYSQVDRLWSVLPTLYIAHFTYFAHHLGLDTSRLDILITLAGLWSVRLTFNYFRKGGYGWYHEDYRWMIVRRELLPRWTHTVFDLTFIAFYQNVLLVLVATPAYIMLLLASLPTEVSSQAAGGYLPTADLVFSRALMLALIAEFFADQQQWRFHQAKAHFAKTGELPATGNWSKSDLERGFCVSGLWSYSRHPNFLAEQVFWVLIYQWSCFVTDSVYNWTGVGALAYCMIFQGSTWLTEKISKEKYTEYADYQRLVGRFVPKLSAFFGRGEEAEAVVPAKEESKKTK